MIFYYKIYIDAQNYNNKNENEAHKKSIYPRSLDDDDFFCFFLFELIE